MLKLRQMIPPLTARTLHPTTWGSEQAPAGRTVQAWDYKQKKSLAVVFLHAGCPRCEKFLARIVERAAEFAEREAVALVIFPEAPAAAVENLPPSIVAAVDMSGRAQRAFLGEDAFGPGGQQQVGVFVADRYGELYAQWAGASEDALPAVGEILSWLAQIQIACEECGVSHWPVD